MITPRLIRSITLKVIRYDIRKDILSIDLQSVFLFESRTGSVYTDRSVILVHIQQTMIGKKLILVLPYREIRRKPHQDSHTLSESGSVSRKTILQNAWPVIN